MLGPSFNPSDLVSPSLPFLLLLAQCMHRHTDTHIYSSSQSLFSILEWLRDSDMKDEMVMVQVDLLGLLLSWIPQLIQQRKYSQDVWNCFVGLWLFFSCLTLSGSDLKQLPGAPEVPELVQNVVPVSTSSQWAEQRTEKRRVIRSECWNTRT